MPIENCILLAGEIYVKVKIEGGLGIPSFHDRNVAFLAKLNHGPPFVIID